MKSTTLGIWVFALTLMLVNPVWAQEHHYSEGGHKGHFALYLGNTHAHGADEFTFGLSYERELSEHWCIGGLIEHAGGEFDTTVFAVPFYYHVNERLFLELAPGVERHSGDSEFLVRAAVGYAFNVNGWVISPELSVDRVDGEYAQGIGISIGRGF